MKKQMLGGRNEAWSEDGIGSDRWEVIWPRARQHSSQPNLCRRDEDEDRRDKRSSLIWGEWSLVRSFNL